jgi:mono/diheme cytochrome c family protein
LKLILKVPPSGTKWLSFGFPLFNPDFKRGELIIAGSSAVRFEITDVAGAAHVASATAGANVFNKSCKGCHEGKDAMPNPALTKMIGVTIPALGSAEVQSKSHADLATIITLGEGTMRPVADVTGNAIDDVIAYIRTLKQ